MQQSKIKWQLIALSYLSLFGLALIDNGRGPIYPQILELLELDTTQGSYLFSIASIIGVLVNATARWWLYPLGAIGSTRLSLVFMIIGSFCFALSGHQNSYFLLLLSSFLSGIGLSMCSITMNVLVAQGTPEEKRKNVFAGLHSIYGIASFLAPFLILGVNKIGQSWMHFFLYVCGLCTCILIWSFTVKTPKETAKENRKVIIPLPYFKRLLFSSIFAFYVASEITISSRLVLYLERAKDFSPEQSSFYLSLFFGLLLSGRVFLAFVKVSVQNQKMMYISLYLSLILFTFGYLVHPIGLALCGLSMSFFFPMAMDWLSKSFPRGMEFMTASAMTSVSLVLGLIHWGFGQIAEHFGVIYAMLIAPICSILCLLCLWFWNKQENGPIIEA